jgi:hypothetical protein
MHRNGGGDFAFYVSKERGMLVSNTYKAFMAGVATVAVALMLGFGGGVLIADWLNSGTAVPEQSKIAKAKAPDPKIEASKVEASEAPKPESAAPKTVQTASVPLTPAPLAAAPQSFTPPAAAQSALDQPRRPVAAPKRTAAPEPGYQREAERAISPRNEPRVKSQRQTEQRRQAAKSRPSETTGSASRDNAAREADEEDEVVESRAGEAAPRSGRRMQSSDFAGREQASASEVKYRRGSRSPIPFFPFFGR